MGENGKKYFKGLPILWILIGVLCMISIVEVFSATSRMTFGAGQSYLRPVLRHVILMGMGLALMYLVHRIPYGWFKYLPLLLVPLSAGALAYLLISNYSTHSAARWINIMGFSLQPSEFAKMGVIIGEAWLLSKMDETDILSQTQTFWRIVILGGIFVVLILPENLSTAGILGIVVYLMMYVGHIRRKFLFLLGGSAVAVVAVMLAIMLLVPAETIEKSPLPDRFTTWQARVLDFFNKGDKPSAIEYARTIVRDKPQETHANIAIARSNIIGNGPGNSVERDFLQEASCDFIYAIIIEELGMAGAIGVMVIYLWILLKVGGIAARCGKRRFPRYLAMGIAFQIAMQALVNMAVAVGIMPVTGQPLPMISTGGSSIFATSIYFGMLLSISWSANENGTEPGVMTENVN